MASPRPWFVYLLQCADGSYYAGISTDVAARFAAHQAGKGARYTRARKPVAVLAQRVFPDRPAALRGEYALKQLPRSRKRAWFAPTQEPQMTDSNDKTGLPATADTGVIQTDGGPPLSQQGIDRAAALLRALGNEHRLLVLCRLLEHGEMTVGQLLACVTVGPSTLSAHLARMRSDGLIDYRRQAQTLHYRIIDPAAAELVATLKRLHGP